MLFGKSRKKEADTGTDTGWVIGNESTEYVRENEDISKYSNNHSYPKPQLNRPLTNDGGIVSDKLISPSFQEKDFLILSRILVVIIVVLLIVSTLIGVFYTKKENLSIITFSKLSSMRYADFLESELKRLNQIYNNFNKIKDDNPISIQTFAKKNIDELIGMSNKHERTKTDYTSTKEIGREAILALTDVLTDYDKLSNKVLEKNSQNLSEFSLKEKKAEQALKNLNDQIYLLRIEIDKK